ncbi:MAG: hypothetical protein JAY75_18880, partial [Candidatus Thiodiazotropha taylori]|nr:hypothetical protein [Candidatus Thiodiazotropha taylori]MCW4310285.1 hypothetical protein [Candidatus Thiodiazotropha endolucinida]
KGKSCNGDKSDTSGIVYQILNPVRPGSNSGMGEGVRRMPQAEVKSLSTYNGPIAFSKTENVASSICYISS